MKIYMGYGLLSFLIMDPSVIHIALYSLQYTFLISSPEQSDKGPLVMGLTLQKRMQRLP